jgi:hypothetical protein
MRHRRWNVTAKTTKIFGVSDRTSMDLMRGMSKLFEKYKVRGWAVTRVPVVDEHGKIIR